MSYTYFISFNGWSYISPRIWNKKFFRIQHCNNKSLWRFNLKRIFFYCYFDYKHFTYKINQKIIIYMQLMPFCTGKVCWDIGCQSLLIFYQWIYIFWKVIAFTYWFLPMIYQLLPLYCSYCQFVPIMIGKIFVKNILVHCNCSTGKLLVAIFQRMSTNPLLVNLYIGDWKKGENIQRVESLKKTEQEQEN